ncbi:hypothetical protein [Desulfohalovibrio reitneri]|uniref:hypothetical protein n=1 Tax=Desulfohalovibrio reitneri TaxID=1307759 RepID=UPI00110E541B|nr:hypothetical protein [Desulfohalovibrio reitneri]
MLHFVNSFQCHRCFSGPTKYISELSLPESTSELGDSIAIIDGLFSSLAIVLGLVAVLIQGKELKESTKAQIDQYTALKEQKEQQDKANLLNAYTAQITFLKFEMGRLEDTIQSEKTKLDELNKNKEKNCDQIKRSWDLIKNSNNLKQRHLNKYKLINEEIEKLLSTLLSKSFVD